MQHRKSILFVLIMTIALAVSLTVKVSLAAGNNDPDEAFGQVRLVLDAIPSGQAALSLMDQYQVQVEFDSGKGTYYLASANTIVIDAGLEPMRAALSFVHEINHAKTWHEGQRANISALSVEEYARLRVEEEAEGVVKSIEAKMELQAAGLDVSNLSYPLETAYQEAYQKARNAATVRERGISEVELKELGRAAGKEAVIAGFVDGKVWTSHTLEPYADFYGKCWSKADTAQRLLSPLSRIVSDVASYDLLTVVVDAVAESC